MAATSLTASPQHEKREMVLCTRNAAGSTLKMQNIGPTSRPSKTTASATRAKISPEHTSRICFAQRRFSQIRSRQFITSILSFSLLGICVRQFLMKTFSVFVTAFLSRIRVEFEAVDSWILFYNFEWF